MRDREACADEAPISPSAITCDSKNGMTMPDFSYYMESPWWVVAKNATKDAVEADWKKQNFVALQTEYHRISILAGYSFSPSTPLSLHPVSAPHIFNASDRKLGLWVGCGTCSGCSEWSG